jgi:hypothetical protein
MPLDLHGIQITNSTLGNSPPPPHSNVLCRTNTPSFTQCIMLQLQTTQQTNTDHVNKSPPNHRPKQNHSPYNYRPTHFHHYNTAVNYMHVSVCMLLHLCYCMFVTVYIITCRNVKKLCVAQRSEFVCFV